MDLNRRSPLHAYRAGTAMVRQLTWRTDCRREVEPVPVHPVQPRQLLYVTEKGMATRFILCRRRSTASLGQSLKLQVGRVGLEPTADGL